MSPEGDGQHLFDALTPMEHSRVYTILPVKTLCPVVLYITQSKSMQFFDINSNPLLSKNEENRVMK